MILAVLTPGLEFDPAEWMAGMDGALELLRFEELHRYSVVTELDSPNWKLTADGYVDGYHIGYLHSSTIGEKAITNRNTYDLFGPHVRIGFANKPIHEIRDRPESVASHVGGHEHGPLPLPERVDLRSAEPTALVRPIAAGPDARAVHDGAVPLLPPARGGRRGHRHRGGWRQLYAQVTSQEDFITGFKINRSLPAMGDDHIRFGRNERGNQTCTPGSTSSSTTAAGNASRQLRGNAGRSRRREEPSPVVPAADDVLVVEADEWAGRPSRPPRGQAPADTVDLVRTHGDQERRTGHVHHRLIRPEVAGDDGADGCRTLSRAVVQRGPVPERVLGEQAGHEVGAAGIGVPRTPARGSRPRRV